MSSGKEDDHILALVPFVCVFMASGSFRASLLPVRLAAYAPI
jgi:hypothetical protein